MNTKQQLRSSPEAGFTMLEMTIAAMMLLALSFLVTSLILSGTSSSKYADRLGRVTEISQEVMDDMQRELRSATRLFQDDAIGNSYLNSLQILSGIPPLSSSKLPTIVATDTFKKDVVGAEKTGSQLLFSRHAWSDSFLCTSGNTWRVDVYRMVHYSMTPEEGGPQAGSPTGLNLTKWVSEPLVDGNQIDSISDATDRAEVLVHLWTQSADVDGQVHPKAEVVWMPGEDPAVVGTLRQIVSGGAMVTTQQAPRTGSWALLEDPGQSFPGMLFYRHHSLATNFSQSNQGVSRFAIMDTVVAGGFPHGMEIQVVGEASSRRVLLHLTLVSTNNAGQKAFYDIATVTDVREG